VDVNADTAATARAAEAVLSDDGLENITSSATRLDGVASGRKADGTNVKVAIKKQEEGTGSTVWVTVGTIGDPALGADIARRIKERAEGAATTRPTT
jgi:hypothetical protein